MRLRVCVTLLLFAVVLVLAACPRETTIAEINADPSRFSGKEVAIRGNVTTSFGALGQGAYEVDDGTGRIWVVSEHGGVPGQGARVRVVGTVATGVMFGGRSFGTVLRESSRKTESAR